MQQPRHRTGRAARGLLGAMILLLVGWAGSAPAEPAGGPARLAVYVFGDDGLHPPRGIAASVPFWLGRIAHADGRLFAADGQSLPPGRIADALPPRPGWRIPGVPTGGGSSGGGPEGGFAWDRYDAVLIAGSTVLADPPDAQTARARLLAAIDGLRAAGLTGRILLLADDPDRSPLLGDMLTALKDARPDAPIAVIPAARLRAELAPLLPATLPNPNDPAPRSAVLNALIAYAWLYHRPPPPRLPLPPPLDGWLNPALPELRARIAAAAGLDPETPFLANPPRPLPWPGVGVENPSIGLDLPPVGPAGFPPPFLDLMKTAAPWRVRDTVTGVIKPPAPDLLTSAGWPKRLPEGSVLETRILQNMPEAAGWLAGPHLLRYRGTGRVVVGGRAGNVTAGDHESAFD